MRKLGFACKFGSSRTGIEFMHLIAERVDLHQRPAWLCVFLNSRIEARATVAGSGARARSRNLVRAASPHL